MKIDTAEHLEHLMVDGRPADPLAPAFYAAVGVLRGEGIFESFRVERDLRTPFFAAHAERLLHSARLMGIDLAGRGLDADWPAFAAMLPPGPWRVRFTALQREGAPPTRCWSAGRPYASPEETVLAMAPYRRDARDPLAAAKTTSRASWQVTRRRAQQSGAWDAVLQTMEGHLSECTTANLLLCSGGTLLTPSLDCGILRGVTRGAVLDGCREAGIPVREAKIPCGELEKAQEIFVTGSIMGVIPVVKILGVRDGLPGASGPWARRIQEIYRERVARALNCSASSRVSKEE